MPEAVKEGGGANDVAAPEDAVPPAAVDLATDGAVEVKPPPATEPSLPDTKESEDKTGEQQEMGETAPEVLEPPKEQSVADKIIVDPLPSTTTNKSAEPSETAKAAAEEANPEKELEEMIAKGRVLLTVKRDYYEAAEILSKACEKSSEIFGELSEKCAELYYLYGCSMLECARSENNILGESLKTKDAEKDNEAGDEEVGGSDGEKGGGEEEEKQEEMEVEEVEESKPDVGTSSSTNGAAETVKENDEADDITKEDEEEEDEDTSLKLSWQMFELAKVAYIRQDNKEKLAETLIKLGEVGVESGHPTAMEDMIAALEIRQKLFPNKRIIPETHFHIGLGYSMFEMFDEAILHFEKAKELLEEIALNLENAGDEDSKKEAKEIRDLLPDLKEKIQDMNDSKVEKRKEMEEALKNGLSAVFNKENGSHCAGTSSEKDKPASNISHLIKRKRKIDEVTSDLPTKVLEEPKRKVQAVEVDEEHSSTSSVSSDSNKFEKKELEKPVNIESSLNEEPMETEEAKSVVSSLTESAAIVPETNETVDNSRESVKKEIEEGKFMTTNSSEKINNVPSSSNSEEESHRSKVLSEVSPDVENNEIHSNVASVENTSDNKQSSEIKENKEATITDSKKTSREQSETLENVEVEMREATDKTADENKTESAVVIDESTKSEGSNENSGVKIANSEDITETVTKVENEPVSKNDVETKIQVGDKTQVGSEPKTEMAVTNEAAGRTETDAMETSCSPIGPSEHKVVETESVDKGEISSSKQQESIESITKSESAGVSLKTNTEDKTETVIQESKLEKEVVVKSSVDTTDQKEENMEVTNKLMSEEKTNEGGSVLAENKESTATNDPSEEMANKNISASTTNEKEAPGDSDVSKSLSDSTPVIKLASVEVKKENSAVEQNNSDSGDTGVTNGCADEQTELKSNNSESIVPKELLTKEESEECSRVANISIPAPTSTASATAAE